MSPRQSHSLRMICALLFLVFSGGCISSSLRAQNAPEVPVVDGGLGGCRADFTVKDGAGKPIYNAKIHTLIKYGFFNKRKSELQVGTNSDGKASVTGLPNMPKTPIEFSIKSGTVETTVTDDPSNNCKVSFDVTLKIE